MCGCGGKSSNRTYQGVPVHYTPPQNPGEGTVRIYFRTTLDVHNLSRNGNEIIRFYAGTTATLSIDVARYLYAHHRDSIRANSPLDNGLIEGDSE